MTIIVIQFQRKPSGEIDYTLVPTSLADDEVTIAFHISHAITTAIQECQPSRVHVIPKLTTVIDIPNDHFAA